MRTKLKIVIPFSQEGDVNYTSNDEEKVSNGINSERYEDGFSDRVHTDVNLKNISYENSHKVTEDNYRLRRSSSSPPREFCGRPRQNEYGRSNNDYSQKQKSQSGHRQLQLAYRPVLKRELERKFTLAQTEHQISSCDVTNGHFVILDKGAMKTRASSAAPKIMETSRNWCQGQRDLGDTSLSVSEVYDVDTEHHDIMKKALRSYSHHCRCDGRDPTNNGSNNDVTRNNKDDVFKDYIRPVSDITSRNGQYTCNLNYYNNLDSSRSVDNSRVVKMSQCLLRFYDDDGDNKTQADKHCKLSWPTSSPSLYTLEDGDGVLADAGGNVYRSRQTRLWSALPGKFSDLVKVNRQGLGFGVDRRFQEPANTNRLQSRGNVNQRNHFKVVTPILGDKMARPIPHAVAYQRRNQTTHMWTDSSQLMSQSVPSASFLHRDFRSSPRSSLDANSEKSSPAGKATKTRPSSSYSYDGGFFVGAHSGQAEYFVIHPDWVSEAVSVRKVSIGDKKTASPLRRSTSLVAHALPDGRRCLSAPPKQRNPITMDHSDQAVKKSK